MDSSQRLFCCLVNDERDNMDRLVINGSSARDVIRFDDGDYILDAWDADLDCEVEALAGNDLIYGSPSTDIDYFERLRGGSGNDQIDGRSGNDELVGGGNDDDLWGGPEMDTLVGRQGFDELFGGEGWDTLCDDDLSSVLKGANGPGASEANILYYSLTPTTGTHVSSQTQLNSISGNCGHLTTHGSSWGNCPAFTVATPPGLCANWMDD